MTRVLVVDDDPVQLRLTAEAARHAGYAPETASGGLEALKKLRADPGIALMILDLVMPDLDGMAVMEAMRSDGILTPVIIQTAHSELETVVSSLRNGAVDFFVKPVAPERLIVSIRNALRLASLETMVRASATRPMPRPGLDDLASKSPAMHRVPSLAHKAARSPHPLLIEGETGSGRQHLARIVHALSDRATRPFVAFSCTSLADADLVAALPLKIAEANGGTLYLSEIGELGAGAQRLVHDMLAENRIMGPGDTPLRVNLRLIASTASRLLHLATSGLFREDLYYRLNVLPIYLPALRERREDIAALASRFIARFAAETGKPITGIDAKALALLAAYDWPGNLRQIENILYRATVLAETDAITPADLPQLLARQEGRAEAARLAEALLAPAAPVHIDAALPRRSESRPASDRFLSEKGEVAPLPEIERELIAFALSHYGGRMSQVARALRIGRSTLYRKLREYGLDAGIESDAA